MELFRVPKQNLEVFMAAMTPAATQPPPIDPTMQFLQHQRDTLYEQTEQNFQKIYPQWEKEYNDLAQLEADVNNRRSNLQHKKEVNPGKEALEAEREGYLQKYWNFKGTSDKISFYASNLTKIIHIFSPPGLSHSQGLSLTEIKRLMEEQPALHDQLTKQQVVCNGYIAKLKENLQKITTLKDKYVSCLNSQSGSLARFCQIVDQEGNPLALSTRASYNLNDMLWNAVVPKPKGINLSSSSALEKSTASSFERSSVEPFTTNSKSSSSQASTLDAKPLQTQPESGNDKEVSKTTTTTTENQQQQVKSDVQYESGNDKEVSKTSTTTTENQQQQVKSDVQVGAKEKEASNGTMSESQHEEKSNNNASKPSGETIQLTQSEENTEKSSDNPTAGNASGSEQTTTVGNSETAKEPTSKELTQTN